jgi:hypothetical protein
MALGALLACLLLPAGTVAAAAYNPFDQACKSGAAQSSDACHTTGDNPVSGDHGILRKATTIVAFVAGVAAVIIIVIAGFRYVTSAGDPQAASGARLALIGAIIGLIIIVVAQSVIVFVLNKVK